MRKASPDAYIHIGLLIAIQWISITAIILNGLAIHMATGTTQGLLMADKGPQDFLLVIIGAVSLLGSSLVLCLHIHVFYRLIEGRPFAPSKKVLVCEVAVGVVLVALWTASVSLIMTTYHVSSPCRLQQSEFVQRYGQACDLLGGSIILAVVAIAAWALVILATVLTMWRPSLRASATLFTFESPSLLCHRGNSMHWLPPQGNFVAAPLPAATRASKQNLGAINRNNMPKKPDDRYKSWDSENSTARHDDCLGYSRPSFTSGSIPLGDLPHIQVGMSRLDLPFITKSYDQKRATYLS